MYVTYVLNVSNDVFRIVIGLIIPKNLRALVVVPSPLISLRLKGYCTKNEVAFQK